MQFFTCFWTALKLGLTSFGGPVAHLGYFRESYVVKNGWISEERFAELLALCQFLPGPASSQLGAAIGYEKGGWSGAIAAWVGFTLPSAVLMTLLAIGLQPISELLGVGWIHGLKLAAVAIVFLAVIGMRKTLCKTLAHHVIALITLFLLFIFNQAWMQPLVILMGGVIGAVYFADYKNNQEHLAQKKGKSAIISLVAIALFILSLGVLPVLQQMGAGTEATGGLLRAGSLVFGGGHVVLPLLESSYVSGGLVTQEEFLAGYGAAQAVPGPMFTLGSYLGALTGIGGNAWLGGLIGTVAIFAPGLFLLACGIPLWNWLKGMPRAKGAVSGANAAVVGLLAAALLHMFTYLVDFDSRVTVINVIFVLALFYFHGFRKMPAWLTVLLAGLLAAFVF